MWVLAALHLGACATINAPISDSVPTVSETTVPLEITNSPIARPEPTDGPEGSTDKKSSSEPSPIPDTGYDSEAKPIASQGHGPITTPDGPFSNLNLWTTADPTPALKAFQKTCKVWKHRLGEKWLNSELPIFGQYDDWQAPCQVALDTQVNRNNAVQFFQTHFEPVNIGAETGLLTAYYAPEIPVRRIASLEFSEPILAKPKDKKVQALPRKDLSVTSSTVLAYGKPIDVFFMQIQGSGQIRFPDGKIYRAAFDGHNGRPYSSIGRVLIARGDMTKDEASKQSIETWMEAEGYLAAKELMAENERYVFFKTEHLVAGGGPKGAMGIPLTPMGSMAVDPKHYPYGVIVWVEGKFPKEGGDYKGVNAGHLLVVQDTGGAIKGVKRGDVYFGNGDAAGAKAGVMKHQATWTLLLPVALAIKTLLVS